MDIVGGAARAAYRLHKGLQANGISSTMMVQFKDSDDSSVIAPKSNFAKGFSNIRISLDHFPKILFSKNKETFFHLQWLPEAISTKIKKFRPDLVHFHWICRAFLNIKTVKYIKFPIIWTLHDMWPLTGGCHYSGGCEQYQKFCGNCPILASRTDYDLSRWTWRRKSKNWSDINLTLVAPSFWMKTRAQQSSLFRDKTIDIIPNGIDLNQYRPLDRQSTRSYLGLPKNKKLILFGAINPLSDRRKGFHLLNSAIKQFARTPTGKESELVIFGASKPAKQPNFSLRSTYVGRLYDDISLSMIYAACDMLVVPSIEDNLPNTIMESMACGTPCLAFRVGGIPEMVSHKKNGYLAEPFSIDDLASGIQWIAEDEEKHKSLSIEARKKSVADFNLEKVTKRYVSLYKKIICNSLC